MQGYYYILCRGYDSQDAIELLLREVVTRLRRLNKNFFHYHSTLLVSGVDSRGVYFMTGTFSDNFDPTMFVQTLFEICESDEVLEVIATSTSMDLYRQYEYESHYELWSRSVYEQLKANGFEE